MKLAVVGSRSFNDYDCLSKELDRIRKKQNITLIVSGGANGADRLAEQYAREHNIEILILKAEWGKYGKRAGYIRNVEIWNNSDFGIAFWDGKSRGTKYSFEIAKKQGKYCKIFTYKFERVNKDESEL